VRFSEGKSSGMHKIQYMKVPRYGCTIAALKHLLALNVKMNTFLVSGSSEVDIRELNLKGTANVLTSALKYQKHLNKTR